MLHKQGMYLSVAKLGVLLSIISAIRELAAAFSSLLNRCKYCISKLFLLSRSFLPETQGGNLSTYFSRIPGFHFIASRQCPISKLRLLLFYIYGVTTIVLPSLTFAYTFLDHNLPSPNPDEVYDYDNVKHLFYTSTKFATTHAYFDTSRGKYALTCPDSLNMRSSTACMCSQMA